MKFIKRKIDFGGHTVKNETNRRSVEKTAVVQMFPESRNAKEIQRFLGLTGYF